MLPMNYKTLETNSCTEFVEKKSRFIGRAFNVTSEEQALGILNEIRSQHWDATHNVYAYVIRDNNIARFSDDGEPAKTAGAPVMNVIMGENLCDCLIIVTRYFGGTLLGAGGLVRAYGKSAKMAVDEAGIAVMTMCIRYSCTVAYTDWGKFQNVIKSASAEIDKSEFAENVYAEVSIDKELSGKLMSEITESFGGGLELSEIEELYMAK